MFEKSFGGTWMLHESDGVNLKVFHAGEGPGKPPIVFVHGYPDTHAVWMPTIARLVDDFHCIAYDVRGAGESSAPPDVDGYRMPHLVSDLVTAIDAYTTHDQPVHLVGHDWGSVQAWDAVLRAGTDRRLRGRIASYTSISGPALGHLSAWAHSAGRRGARGRLDLLRQAGHSWYMAAFQVPMLPETVLRAGLPGPGWMRRLGGLPPNPAPTIAEDAVNGLGLYRANRHRPVDDRTPLQTDLPVQLIVPVRDRFIIPQVYDDLPLWCSNLTRHDIHAGHWVMQTHPDQIAGLISTFLHDHP